MNAPTAKFLSTQLHPEFALDLAANSDPQKPMRLRVVVMQAGMSADGNYFFPAEALEKTGPKALNNVKMYVNHPDFIENMSGGRNVRNYVSILRDVKWDKTKQALVGEAIVFDSDWRKKLNDMAAAEVLDTMDLSVHVDWDHEQRKDGVLAMTALKPHPTNSLDFVYVANAGGGVEARLAASMQNKEKDTMDEKEVQAKIEAALKPVQEQLDQALKLAEDEKAARLASEEKLNLAEAQKTVSEKLAASKLPEPAIKFLAAKFAGKSDISQLDAEIKLASELQASLGVPEKKPEPAPTPAPFGIVGLGEFKVAQAAPHDDTRAALILSYKNRFVSNGAPEAQAQSRAEALVAGLKSE